MSPRIVAYTRDQTHSSVARAARHLGFRPDQVRVLPTDEEFRIRPDALAAMDADVAIGRLPFWFPATPDDEHGRRRPDRGRSPRSAAPAASGSTSTRRTAASPSLTDRGREALSGLELADSVTLDPHKWLYQPFEVGCLHGPRQGGLLEDGLRAINPDTSERVGRLAAVNFARTAASS